MAGDNASCWAMTGLGSVRAPRRLADGAVVHVPDGPARRR